MVFKSPPHFLTRLKKKKKKKENVHHHHQSVVCYGRSSSVLVEAINALCDEEKGGVNSLCCSRLDVVVVNDECAYTFDGPLHYSSKRKRRKTADASGNENDDDDDDDDDDDRDDCGIFVNMKTLRATTRKYLQLDSKKTEKQGLYVTRKWTKVFFEEEEEKEGGEDSKMDDSKKNA